MHPYLTEAMAKAHMEDLHREAARHRLAAQGRGARPAPVHAWWSTVKRAFEQVAVSRASTRAPQPVCCPA